MSAKLLLVVLILCLAFMAFGQRRSSSSSSRTSSRSPSRSNGRNSSRGRQTQRSPQRSSRGRQQQRSPQRSRQPQRARQPQRSRQPQRNRQRSPQRVGQPQRARFPQRFPQRPISRTPQQFLQRPQQSLLSPRSWMQRGQQWGQNMMQRGQQWMQRGQQWGQNMMQRGQQWMQRPQQMIQRTQQWGQNMMQRGQQWGQGMMQRGQQMMQQGNQWRQYMMGRGQGMFQQGRNLGQNYMNRFQPQQQRFAPQQASMMGFMGRAPIPQPRPMGFMGQPQNVPIPRPRPMGLMGDQSAPQRGPAPPFQYQPGQQLTRQQNRDLMLRALRDSGITDPRAQANILANIEVESQFRPRSESLNYTPQRLREIFPKYYRDPALANQHGRNGNRPANQEAIGNRVYGGRMGNAQDEGWKYRGRGYIQLTGRDNYNRVGSQIGVDLVNNPDLVNDPWTAARASATFFQPYNQQDLRSIDRVIGIVGPAHKESFPERRRLADQWYNEIQRLPQ